MPSPDLCTELEIAALVDQFYTRVRADPQLGPIFNARIEDWNHHLLKLCAFWSAILRGTARYSGTPMPRHNALPQLSGELFRRWLQLFELTASEQPNRAMADAALLAASRIARSLWFGYQMNRDPQAMPAELPQNDLAGPAAAHLASS